LDEQKLKVIYKTLYDLWQLIDRRVENHLNSSNAELNPICHLLALLGAHPILHVSRIMVKRQKRKFLKYASKNVKLGFKLLSGIYAGNWIIK